MLVAVHHIIEAQIDRIVQFNDGPLLSALEQPPPPPPFPCLSTPRPYACHPLVATP